MGFKGVNLGNWLVLEKWMHPAMFSETDAEDETWLTRLMEKEQLLARLEAHRKSYITKQDFAKIAKLGLSLVRIPIPYSIFGDRPPFPGCAEYLDNAFSWAAEYGLKILVDLHTTPGNQNGYDNGGIVGVCKWHKNAGEVEFVLALLEKLSRRYGREKALFGIEVVNEPISLPVYLTAPTTGKARDAGEAEGSGYVPMHFLKQFYSDAYHRMRKYLPEEKAIVFHDGFRYLGWKNYFRKQHFGNVYLDCHYYIWAMEMFVPFHTPKAYQKYLDIARARILDLQKEVPVIVGEWSICNRYALNAETFSELKRRFRQVAKMELKAFSAADGWLYWSYRLSPDIEEEMDEEWKESWDLTRCIRNGWMPRSYKKKRSSAEKEETRP